MKTMPRSNNCEADFVATAVPPSLCYGGMSRFYGFRPLNGIQKSGTNNADLFEIVLRAFSSEQMTISESRTLFVRKTRDPLSRRDSFGAPQVPKVPKGFLRKIPLGQVR
ncbi:MAG: hypothetical protein HY088_04440 [Ignavibacteriales bacterium]|nr:hypothetical protein [Ignavibacteriales bacterium]